MSKIGCNYPCFAPFSGEEPAAALPNYGTGIELGKLIEANLTINLATGDVYANDAIAESASEFSSGSLAMATDDMVYAAESVVFGSSLSDDELTDGTADTAPYGGLAYYKTLLRNGVKYYEGYFYPKVKAALGNDSIRTKGNNISFQNTLVNFVVMKPNVSKWRYRKLFTTEAAAKAWVATKVSVATWYAIKVAVSGSGTVSPLGTVYVASGGSLDVSISGTPEAAFDNGTSITASITGGKYSLTNVTADHSIVIAY
jgi:hypothetical protein